MVWFGSRRALFFGSRTGECGESGAISERSRAASFFSGLPEITAIIARGASGRRTRLCAMTSHGDAIEKMSAFASRADSFVNAALDQLDDAVEQAFVGETSGDVEAVQKASLTPQQQSLLRAAAAFWSDLALDAKREDWRDAATRVTSAQAGAEASKRALAERAEAARREPSDSEARDALTRALTKELAAVTKRAAFAETAFMSMLNDIDEAPDPAVPLALAQDAALVVTAAARARQELETLRAARGGGCLLYTSPSPRD